MLSGSKPSGNRPLGLTASFAALRRRADLLAEVRQFFCQRGFLEVETPLLCSETVVDRHLDPLPIDARRAGIPGRDSNGTRDTWWLQTSPELGMKRLLAAGSGDIFQITRAFRAGEVGRLHNIEFTMLEWYAVNDSVDTAIERLRLLADRLLQRGLAHRMPYAEAFAQVASIDPHRATCRQLRDAASDLALPVPTSIDPQNRDDWLDLLFALAVQPTLGKEVPLVLYDYPASQAALATIRRDEIPVAERFELFLDGVELANGYHELRDADELSARITAANAQRRRDGKMALPVPHKLLDAMRAGLPPCCGVAMGLDRVTMLACGADNLAEVIALPVDRA